MNRYLTGTTHRLETFVCLRGQHQQLRRWGNGSTCSYSSFQHPPTSSTAVQPSILEKSPKRRELSRLLRELQTFKHFNGYSTLFNEPQIEQALSDLEKIDPVLKIAILSLKGVKNAVHLQSALILTPRLGVDIDSPDSDYSKVLRFGNLKQPSGLLIRLGNTETGGITADDVAVIDIGSPPLEEIHRTEVFATSLANVMGEIDPLCPPLRLHPRPIFYPVHMALIVQDGPEEIKYRVRKPSSNRNLLKIVDHDAPISTTPVPVNTDSNDGKTVGINIAIEMARKALILMIGKEPSLEIAERIWKRSGVEHVRWAVYNSIKRTESPSIDILPKHVSDLILSILSTRLPLSYPAFELFDENVIKRETISAALKDFQARASFEILNLESWYKDFKISMLPVAMDFQLLKAAADIERIFLTNSERDIAFLYGMMYQQGKSLPTTAKINQKAMSGAFTASELMEDIPAYKGDLEKLTQAYRQVHRIINHPTNLTSNPKFIAMERDMIMFAMADLRKAVRVVQSEFWTTIGLGATGAGLVGYFGHAMDSVLVFALSSAVFIVLLRRASAKLAEYWQKYMLVVRARAIAAIRMEQDWITACAKGEFGNRPDDLALYRDKCDELVRVKKLVSDAKAILLELSPSLRKEELLKKQEDKPKASTTNLTSKLKTTAKTDSKK